MTQPSAASPTLGIQEAELGNGLKILTLERHTAPVASVWAWVRVGSRNERPGLTGASHWVEHMLFKGGREFAKGEIFKQVARHGGTNNGFTWLDFTAYYETLPAEALDLGLRIEADRMANALGLARSRLLARRCQADRHDQADDGSGSGLHSARSSHGGLPRAGGRRGDGLL